MNVHLQGESGAAFAAKAFWRAPLARLAAHIAPEIADECPTRMLNSSAGLEEPETRRPRPGSSRAGAPPLWEAAAPRKTKGGEDDSTSNVHSVQQLNGQWCKGAGESGQARDGSLHVFHQYRTDCRVCREKGAARKGAPALARSTVSRSCHDWTRDQNPRRRSREGRLSGR